MREAVARLSLTAGLALDGITAILTSRTGLVQFNEVLAGAGYFRRRRRAWWVEWQLKVR